METDPTRLLRLRSHESLAAAALSHATAMPPRGTPRFLGQVVGGTGMPTGTGQVYLTNPVRLDGGVAEGTTASLVVDGSRTIPVVVIGGTPPQAGNVLVAMAVGGRWVAESGASSPVLPCSPCNIPKKNLTLSWTNSLFGDGSTPLSYASPGHWTSACTNQLLFSLACPGSMITLTVTYFLSGSCPTGQSQSCVSPGYDPFTLSLESSTCSPFFLQYTVTGAGCPVLWSNGYSSLTITE